MLKYHNKTKILCYFIDDVKIWVSYLSLMRLNGAFIVKLPSEDMLPITKEIEHE